jgi:hypothetical protein
LLLGQSHPGASSFKNFLLIWPQPAEKIETHVEGRLGPGIYLDCTSPREDAFCYISINLDKSRYILLHCATFRHISVNLAQPARGKESSFAGESA